MKENLQEMFKEHRLPVSSIDVSCGQLKSRVSFRGFINVVSRRAAGFTGRQ